MYIMLNSRGFSGRQSKALMHFCGGLTISPIECLLGFCLFLVFSFVFFLNSMAHTKDSVG